MLGAGYAIPFGNVNTFSDYQNGKLIIKVPLIKCFMSGPVTLILCSWFRNKHLLVFTCACPGWIRGRINTRAANILQKTQTKTIKKQLSESLVETTNWEQASRYTTNPFTHGTKAENTSQPWAPERGENGEK